MHTQDSNNAAMVLLRWQCTHTSDSCYGLDVYYCVCGWPFNGLPPLASLLLSKLSTYGADGGWNWKLERVS
jgi:hypothetical protein